jgi:hypothetical protein
MVSKIKIIDGTFDKESSTFIGSIEAFCGEFENLKAGDELELAWIFYITYTK